MNSLIEAILKQATPVNLGDGTLALAVIGGDKTNVKVVTACGQECTVADAALNDEGGVTIILADRAYSEEAASNPADGFEPDWTRISDPYNKWKDGVFVGPTYFVRDVWTPSEVLDAIPPGTEFVRPQGDLFD